MLIASPRHTRKDLALWMELEAADQVHEIPIGRVERSREAIRVFAERGRCYCSVSWGKDSVVVAWLVRAIDRGIPLVHLRPTNHNPDCDAVRDAYFRDFPGQLYHEELVDYTGLHSRNLPDDELDRKTNALWFAAFARCAKQFGQRYITGIRADESAARKLRCRNWGESSRNTCAPIAWWRVADVLAFLCQNNLPLHPAYACLGGGRWHRENMRVAELGDTRGGERGRAEWEREYYGPEIRRLESV